VTYAIFDRGTDTVIAGGYASYRAAEVAARNALGPNWCLAADVAEEPAAEDDGADAAEFAAWQAMEEAADQRQGEREQHAGTMVGGDEIPW
jgi:hypothetical protein